MSDEPRWRRYRRFFGFRGVADLDDELRFHVEMRVRDYMARGMSEPEARAATARRLGDLGTARDTCAAIATRRERRMTRARTLEMLSQDIRVGVRSLARQKGWTAVAVLTLAIGIGATAAMFSVVNHLLLNPLPYPGADRVALVWQEPSRGGVSGGMTVSLLPTGRAASAWRANSRSFEALEPYYTNDVTLQRPGEPARVARTAEVLATFAAFAGERPIAGRLFSAAETRGEASVALLSEGLWRRHHGADPSIIGRTMTLNEKPVTIIGVMPASLALPRLIDAGTDVWLPLDLRRRADDGLRIVGRLRPGVSPAAAGSELDSILARDASHAGSARYRTILRAPAELIRYQDSLFLLSGAVAVVLLIACANVAHLLLARASSRQREMAIRAALGAGAGRLLRQLLTESLLLAAAGCVAGFAIGALGLRLLVAARPESLAELATARMDALTLAVTAGVAAITGIVFGIIGALQAVRLATHEALKAGSLTSSPTRSRGRARGVLVVTEMAFSTMLLVGAALLVRSVLHLQSRELGFDPRGLYAVDVHLPEERYRGPADRAPFFSELMTRVRALPGVEGVALVSAAPMAMNFAVGALHIEGQPEPPAGTSEFIPSNGVDPGYFRLMGIRLVQGTTFTDTTAGSSQAIVNEGFARKHWPGQSAIGRRLRILYDGQGPWMTVVGVASDVMTRGLTADAGEPLLYRPGTGGFSPTLLVRTSGDARLLPVLAGLAATIDRRLPPPQMTSVELAIRKSIARPRFTMFLLLTFTAVAVGLAAIGLYGVLSYTVAQRTREIGIRIALGASRRKVARLVLAQGFTLAALGATVGLAGARWSAQLVGSMLYGVRPTDAVAFTGSAAILLCIAALACMVPMRRALSVDPSIAMKAE